MITPEILFTLQYLHALLGYVMLLSYLVPISFRLLFHYQIINNHVNH